jgi:hypothetical protein
MQTPLLTHLHQGAAQAAAGALRLLAAGHTYQPSRAERFAMALLLATSPALVFGQAGAGGRAVGALRSVQTIVISIVQVLFIIVLAIGLVRVVQKFISGAPDALGSLGWLMGGVILWFGFNYFKEDLASAMGGGEGGVTP